ncbi:MAG: hypothetical protein IT245_07755 [Bacteroidia bacterium]|nr:hypothetical protein [Bacteroidia bacterium]
MHDIEPHYNWLHLYNSVEDEYSPFFERVHSEFVYENTIYNYLIHPQWDDFGSSTLYIKILFVDYENGFCIIEMMGEWNDILHNDIMTFKREIIELLEDQDINKFILIGENVLNFHSSDDSYYEEWYNDIEDEGWIALVNFRDHVLEEFKQCKVDYFVNFGGELDNLQWRKQTPMQFYNKVEQIILHRLS